MQKGTPVLGNSYKSAFESSENTIPDTAIKVGSLSPDRRKISVMNCRLSSHLLNACCYFNNACGTDQTLMRCVSIFYRARFRNRTERNPTMLRHNDEVQKGAEYHHSTTSRTLVPSKTIINTSLQLLRPGALR